MANYILVHGGNMSAETWNRLTKGKPYKTADGRMGGMIWDPVTAVLEAKGHRCFAPTLKDEHSNDLTENIGEISSIITDNDLKEVVLAGHSYGGMVITGTAAKFPDRVKHMVYVDAALPSPGQSLFDIIKGQGVDPLSFAGLEADPPYVEQIQFDPKKIKDTPKTYIRCTKSDFAVVTQAAKKIIDAEPKSWTYLELPSSHVPMAEMPEELTKILLDAAK